MSVLDQLDIQDAAAKENALVQYLQALHRNYLDETPPETVRDWLTRLGLTRNDVRADQMALRQHATLQSEMPSDEELAQAIQDRQKAKERVDELAIRHHLEREQANNAMNATYNKADRIENKRRTIRDQLATLRKNNARALASD